MAYVLCIMTLFQENLVVMYTPAQLATFNLYHPVSTSRARQTQAPSAATNLNHQPALVAVNFLTDVAAQAHSGLGDAVKELGGIGVFLYLFAWVSGPILFILFENTLKTNNPTNRTHN